MIVIWISWVYWDREPRRLEPFPSIASPSETNTYSDDKLKAFYATTSRVTSKVLQD